MICYKPSKLELCKTAIGMKPPIKGLKGIETGASISGYMNVSAKNCDLLEDLEPLNYSNVKQIVFDKKNYDRLYRWYIKNREKIKTSGPFFLLWVRFYRVAFYNMR
jgi:hypothetical protein